MVKKPSTFPRWLISSDYFAPYTNAHDTHTGRQSVLDCVYNIKDDEGREDEAKTRREFWQLKTLILKKYTREFFLRRKERSGERDGWRLMDGPLTRCRGLAGLHPQQQQQKCQRNTAAHNLTGNEELNNSTQKMSAKANARRSMIPTWNKHTVQP